ncbi:putative leucine-rich repeat-containing protein DDB_G0290503 isoform X1 [Microplitis demolitor]|uniref:putative leucine-rich repeat-containing protein DDB_G0290503 isoform X1 n=1 Tax=Microplitis demolitor TaxID=69319 RepID=UPI0004CD2CE8|nr:putative leucine-rich repeat-containing protein DDB_G0290503 isoform X1 [Microplitis demolitor]
MNELNENDNNLIKFNDSDVIDSDEISILRRQINQLTTENDNYKQEIHLLQGKLSASVTMQNELLENIDSLEESLKKNNESVDLKIRQVETKHGIKIKELMDRINELENELSFQTDKINDVQGKLNEANDKLLLAANSTINSTFTKVDDQDSDDKVKELVQLLADEESKSFKLENALKELEQDMFEMREAYNTTKEQLKEKSSVLEETRDELAECRSELMSLRATPSDQQSKGNSLFAEVEDRRKKSLDTITKLKQSFFDAKKALNIKEAEIKALKAEKAALLTTIEDDKDDTIQQNANLIEKYKDRISELEVKLKDQQKKFWLLEKQKSPVGDEFKYFENMLSAKKKEIEELSAKLENKSIQTLIEEEIKCQTNQQLRYWRRKATTKEAQLEAIKCRLETDSSGMNNELLKLIKQTGKPDNCLYNEETNSSITVKVADSTLDNTQRLIEIPKLHKEMNAEKKVERFSIMIDKPKPLDSDLIDFTESAIKNTDKVNEIENSICILSEKNHAEKRGILKSTKEVWTTVSSSSLLSQSASTALSKNNGKENKSIRFSEDTVDPMPKKLTKQINITPKYPIIYAPSKSKTEK